MAAPESPAERLQVARIVSKKRLGIQQNCFKLQLKVLLLQPTAAVSLSEFEDQSWILGDLGAEVGLRLIGPGALSILFY